MILIYAFFNITYSPSNFPTLNPSTNTISPTKYPTPNITIPTPSPTNDPTRSPTTGTPTTGGPSASPTIFPTILTNEPTRSPTTQSPTTFTPTVSPIEGVCAFDGQILETTNEFARRCRICNDVNPFCIYSSDINFENNQFGL